ncbi:uncharacterized protein TRIADDRAFT_56665 [Trichoplax adhaerens]|uniref:Uncharacterized protein n=1 Tax=Trichoplax adhaerens TaxID=10228 RepID=B3RW90_TRIAD|nr:hypothetical protein TRIADDRAFT_56665 [Trichoplax adhaerens]EDV24649.1 hypothetical protein TRIADDRAFT_56665 [Trichoplax adhaerens]|eukprot:XP_002112539.1 hypothetical protein TRIADDRAFT_56665 [Trichoplax adhaerens]
MSLQDSGSSENPSESQSLTSLTTNDDDKDETDCAKKLFIELRPKCLDFGRRPVGITHQETISISINLKYAAANRKPVKLLYLSSSIHDFQFDNSSRTIYPRENNSIQIIFHPRQFGKRDETIYFHFSIGNPILLNVTGIGIANPFKLPLFFAAKLPLNASYSPLIKVFNPYDTTLQISEVFSSSGEIHLEFPTETAAAKHPWVIPAHQTHTISRLAFLGAIENNYTAYLCIHTNASLTNSSIIVPIQIEVTTAPGLFSITNLFDFGIIEGSDNIKTFYVAGIIKSIDIYLLHIGKKQTQIADISVVPSHEAVSVKFNSKVKLKSDGIYRKVGTILLDSDKISNEEFLTGVIKIKSNNRHAYKLDIPYCATIHKGWLKFSKNSVTIQIKTGTTSVIIRPLTLENHFRIPLSVSKIKLDKGKALVKISQFSKFDVLLVGKIVTLFQFNINCSKYKSPVSTSLTLYTNLTSFRVPIQIFDGSLKFYRNKIGVSSLNFDTVATNDIRLVSLLVKNINPINITILKIRSSLDCISIFPQNDAKLATLQNPLIMVPELEINFTIRLESPDTAGLYIGQIEFITDHEELQLPWKFKSVNVNIRPGLDPIVFSPSFPSRREIQTLWMTSNYHPFTKIKSIQYDPSDIRFEFSFANESSSSLKGDESTLVGYLSFIPSKDIQYRYIGLNQPELDNAAWIKSLQLDQETTAVDRRFYNKLQEKWKYLEDNGLTSSVHQLKIETDIIENINVTVQASLMWPSIITTEGPIIYPLTHPKNYSSKVVALVNPSDQNIIVQAVLLPDYPSQQAALDIIEDGVVIDTDSQSLNGFKLQMAAHSDYESISTIDGIKSHPASLSFLLKPRGRANITVSFTPSDYRVSSTFLLIRNNLTIIDSILLQGQGGRGELQLHGDNISCNGSLQFVAHPSDLLHCSDKKSSHFNTASKFEILSKFIMENSGKLPIFVKKMDINGFECSGYGFEIKNCTSFLLNPKHNIQIDIGFEPDFSISVIERTLRIHTSDDGIREFNLIAILPHYLLPNCSSLRITPSWINWTSKIAWLIMTGILIFIVGLAMSKSKNISRQILPLICDDKANGNVAHYSPSTDVFDLKALINTKQLFENAENLLDE